MEEVKEEIVDTEETVETEKEIEELIEEEVMKPLAEGEIIAEEFEEEV